MSEQPPASHLHLKQGFVHTQSTVTCAITELASNSVDSTAVELDRKSNADCV